MKIRFLISMLIMAVLLSISATTLNAAWFKSISGDVHSNSRIDFNPGTISGYASIENFSSGLIVGDSGIITHDDSTPDVSDGSETPALSGDPGINWVVQSGSFPRDGDQYGYNYYNTLLTNKNDLSSDPNFIQGNCNTSPSSGVYYISGDLTIDCPGGLTLPDGDYVFLVGGNLLVNTTIRLFSENNFVAFIANRDIVIRGSVDGGTALNPGIQGMYIADQRFITQADNNPIFLEGIFIAWAEGSLTQGFVLQRSAGIDEVAETFIYRPELIFSLPDVLKESNTSWDEVMP